MLPHNENNPHLDIKNMCSGSPIEFFLCNCKCPYLQLDIGANSFLFLYDFLITRLFALPKVRCRTLCFKGVWKAFQSLAVENQCTSLICVTVTYFDLCNSNNALPYHISFHLRVSFLQILGHQFVLKSLSIIVIHAKILFLTLV